jgi:hypothetical protein
MAPLLSFIDAKGERSHLPGTTNYFDRISGGIYGADELQVLAVRSSLPYFCNIQWLLRNQVDYFTQYLPRCNIGLTDLGVLRTSGGGRLLSDVGSCGPS